MGLFGDIIGAIGDVAGAVVGTVVPGPVGGLISGTLIGDDFFGKSTQAPRRAPRRLPPSGRTGGFAGGVRINPPIFGAPGTGAGIRFAGPGARLPFSGGGDIAGGPSARFHFDTNNGRATTLPMVGAIGVDPILTEQPTRRCPTGMVLAIDGRCYPKQMVSRQFRAWPTPKHGPISRSEMVSLRKASTVEKKVKRLGRLVAPGRKTLDLGKC